jgi:hypothetical protein
LAPKNLIQIPEDTPFSEKRSQENLHDERWKERIDSDGVGGLEGWRGGNPNCNQPIGEEKMATVLPRPVRTRD